MPTAPGMGQRQADDGGGSSRHIRIDHGRRGIKGLSRLISDLRGRGGASKYDKDAAPSRVSTTEAADRGCWLSNENGMDANRPPPPLEPVQMAFPKLKSKVCSKGSIVIFEWTSSLLTPGSFGSATRMVQVWPDSGCSFAAASVGGSHANGTTAWPSPESAPPFESVSNGKSPRA